MPEYRRADVKGGTYFFTVITYRRQPVLTQPTVRAALREAIDAVRSARPFVVDAWVLLPDHLHCIWTLPPADADYPRRWGMIKRHVSRCCGEFVDLRIERNESRRKRRESTFWQRRYWEHMIRDETDYRRHADYIHWNPVKHGLVQRAIDWPYSTFHRHVRAGTYPASWGMADADGRDYGE